MVSDNAYELILPSNMKIYNVFNVSKLKKYIDANSVFPSRPIITKPLPTLLVDSSEEAWEVKEIVNKRIVKRGNKNIIEYLVLWKDFPEYEKSWECVYNLRYAKEAIKLYEESIIHNNNNNINNNNEQ